MANKNFGGRPIGSQNKVTKEMRESLKLIFDNELSLLKANLETLEPKDRINFLVSILPYMISKMPTETIINEQPLPARFEFDIEVLDGDGTIINTHKISKEKFKQ
jgi:hypothetical protein